MKKFAGDIIILHMCTKNHNHMMYGSWDMEWDRQKILSFWAIFCPFTTPQPPNDPEYQTFEKKMKKMPGDIILLYIHVYHKWRLYDIWFLKYKVRQTEIFAILGHFLPCQSPDNPKNQNFEKLKKTGDIIILHVYHKWQSYDAWFPRQSMTDRIFCHFGPFFVILPS